MTTTSRKPRPASAVVCGVGEVGRVITRLLVERGVEVVAAIGLSATKVGRNLGEVAGLGTLLNVKTEAEPAALLARDADIGVICVVSYLQTR